MKKVLYILILIFVFIPFNIVKADYKIQNYKIYVIVLSNGDLQIQEIIKMNSPYNGYERIINFKDNYNDYLGNIISSVEDRKKYDASSIKLNEVRAINYDDTKTFSYLKENGDLFKKVNTATKGDYGVYIVEKSKTFEKYKIYNSSMMNKDFYLDYTLENVAISHSDISEIPFNISNFQEGVESLEVYIHIPNNKNVLNAFIHNINGSVEVIAPDILKISINNIKERTNFDFRIICDRFETFKKKNNEIVYKKILKLEENINNEFNNKDEDYIHIKSLAYDSYVKASKTLKEEDYKYAKQIISSLDEKDNLKTELIVKLMNVESRMIRRNILIKLLYTSILFSWFVCLIILLYHIYKRYDKEYKVIFKDEIITYIPSNISYLQVRYLFKRKIDNKSIKASILNLIYNDKIKFSKIGNEFILRVADKKNLSESDLKLIKLIFEDKNMIKSSRLNERISKDYNTFLTNYSNYITISTIEFEKLDYYLDILFPKIIGILLSIIGFIIGSIFLKKDTYFPSYIVLFSSIISLIYFIYLSKKTAKGLEEYNKWKAFRKNLNNICNNTNIKTIDDINKYLLYAIIFDNYKKVVKKFNLKYMDKKIYKQIKNSLYINECISCLVDNSISKAYSSKNTDIY